MKESNIIHEFGYKSNFKFKITWFIKIFKKYLTSNCVFLIFNNLIKFDDYLVHVENKFFLFSS